MVRIASYNVENLFDRVSAFDKSDPADNQAILKAYEEVNALFDEAAYSEADKERMVALLIQWTCITSISTASRVGGRRPRRSGHG